MAELVEEYQREARQYLKELERLLWELEKNPREREIQKEALRAAHNLQRISAHMGFETIADLAHELETLLKGEDPPDYDLLFQKWDRLQKMVTNLSEPSDPESTRKGLEVLAEKDEDLYQAFRELLEESCTEKPPELEEFWSEISSEIERLSERLWDQETSGVGNLPVQTAAVPKSQALERVEDSLPEIALRVDPERMVRLSNRIEEFQTLGYFWEELVREIKGYLPRKWRIRLEEALLHFKTTLRTLEEDFRQLRLIPVEAFSVKIERLFRELMRKTGKDADLLFEGENVQVDRLLWPEIWPALVHLLRNAFDHGLETPEERERLGKPRRGRIRLRLAVEQNWLRLTVADDGRGIDWPAVERKVRERGLRVSSPEEALFRSGIFTRSENDRFSGRGLDVVRRKVEALRGYITLETLPGEGTEITLHFPLETTVNRVLLLKVRGERWAIPFYALREVRRVSPAHLHKVEERWLYNYQGESVEVVLPEEALLARSHFYLLLMIGSPAWALAAGEILGTQEASLKPFMPSLKAYSPFLGLAMLSGGGVAFVLDHRSLEDLTSFIKDNWPGRKSEKED